MPLIEGIGDEVTLVLGAFILCIILMLAWFSTHTADIPLLREVGVIVVELSQRRSRAQNTISEERLERDGISSSIERESSSTNVERQQNEADNIPSTTSDPQTGSATENNNIAVEGAPTSGSPSPDEGTHLQASGVAEVETSSDLVPEHADTITSKSDQVSFGHTSPQISRQSEDQIVPDSLNESETLVPKASVVVDDNIGFAYPSEEEIRQRRVQYFQANKITQAVNGESATHPGSEDNTSSSLSDTVDSDNTRHLKGNGQSSYFTTSDQTKKTSGETQENGASVSVADAGSIASSLLQEDISDTQSSGAHDDSLASSSKIRVRLKYMNETQRLVLAKPLDTIGEFRRAHFQAELQDNKWVRFIYNGQDLRDDARTLQACNIGDNCTMHCLITAQTQPHLLRDAAPDEDEDSFMGTMMYPLFTVIILIVWYFRFTYRQYFSAMSTVCLIGISFLLALSYISSLRTADRVIPEPRTGATSTATGGEGGAVVLEGHQHVD